MSSNLPRAPRRLTFVDLVTLVGVPVLIGVINYSPGMPFANQLAIVGAAVVGGLIGWFVARTTSWVFRIPVIVGGAILTALLMGAAGDILHTLG